MTPVLSSELHALAKLPRALANTNITTQRTTMVCAPNASQRKYSFSGDAGLRSSLTFLLKTRLVL